MEILNYPNYLIHDDSRVFSEKRNIVRKPQKNNKGYEYVNLCKNGKYKHFLIHRLVAIHYIPNPENKPCVDHIDGNKLNNNVSNLRWTTNIKNLNNYQSIHNDNKLCIKNISSYKNSFRFQKVIYGKYYQKYHKNLNELIWYKFTFLLINRI